MLAAQVNARKHDNLRMILGFVWIWGLGLCEALLGWVLVAAAAAGRAFGRLRTEDPSPPVACWRELCSDLHRTDVPHALFEASSQALSRCGSTTSRDLALDDAPAHSASCW